MSRRQQAVRPDFRSRETGGIRKKWKDKLPIALVFPNHYRLGMSNLGFQLVYSLLNKDPDIVCERVFLPENDDEPPLSVESGRPLSNFPLIFCSLSFEDDYPNLLRLLVRGGISPLAEERLEQSETIQPGAPLIVAGGVATFINPEPMASFIDLYLIGEAEVTLPPVLEILKKRVGEEGRSGLLYRLATGPAGCYVPSLYTPVYEEDRFVSFKTAEGAPERIVKLTASSREIAGHSELMSPDAEFSDLYLTELGRGCSRGCRFCAAGFVYRPPRLWAADAIVGALQERPSGVSRVGLLGMEMARAGDLAVLAEYLMEQECSLSFSSLRADVIGPQLIELLGGSGLKSAAIAPDGGSERLRRVINKGITEPELLVAAEALAEIGVSNLKLYYMIGLPTETEEDLGEMVDLTLRIKERVMAVGRRKGHLGTLILSVNCFVPKPWTPFQYYPLAPLDELKKRLRYLRKKLGRESNIRIIADHPDRAFFQASLAKGDRRLGPALLKFAIEGGNWRQIMKRCGLLIDDFVFRERTQDEPFPWDIVDHGIERGYLWSEYRKALVSKSTSPCDTSICKRCGVCNDNGHD